MPVHTDAVSIDPGECNMICSASSGNCVLDSKVDDGDVHMSADKLLDSSTSCSGNEESSTEKDTDSFKLYGCGICCQSFSTKEETMALLPQSLTYLTSKCLTFNSIVYCVFIRIV